MYTEDKFLTKKKNKSMRDCGAENIKDFNLSTLQAEIMRISEREDEVCVCVSLFIHTWQNL